MAIEIQEVRDASELKIGGLTRFTTIDFPGCISAVVFIKGCPWNCIYCQNQDLRNREFADDEIRIPWEYVANFLEKRHGLIDGVVFSGGEPCMDPALPEAVRIAKELGYKIGLHTGGAYPRRLAQILPMLDWVGFDVKAPLTEPEGYERVVRRNKAIEHARESLDLLLTSGVDYEIRCTAHPDYLSPEDLKKITRELAARNIKNFALQIYRQPPGMPEEEVLERVGVDYPGDEILELMRVSFPKFTLRRT